MSKNSLVSTSFGARDKVCGAITCPVFSIGNRFISALSPSVFQKRFSVEAVANMSALLLEETRALNESLGGQWPEKR